MWISDIKTSSMFDYAIAYLCVVLFSQINICDSQRNRPQSVSNSNDGSDLYTYGRGDIPIFNPGDPHGALLNSLRELIIAIQ